MKRPAFLSLVLFALLAAGCGDDAPAAETTTATSLAPEPTTTTVAAATTTTVAGTTTTVAASSTTEGVTTTDGTATTEAPTAGPALLIASTDLGDILTSSEGATLYLFEPDAQGTPTCNDSCAGTWPPLTDELAAGEGIDAALMGTVERADGSTQVTYNGWPLYAYSGDTAPGDTNGQGASGVWFVVDASGEPVT